MNHKLWKLIIYNLATDVVNTFVMIFVNLYIWQKGKTIVDLAWFNLSQFAVWMVAYTIGAWMLHRMSIRKVFQLSSIFTLVLFLVLSFAEMKSLLSWLILIGSCNGFMKGFASSGKNLGVSAFGEKDEFNSYFQYSMLLTKVFQIITPILFAFLIHMFGYKEVFVMMCGYSVVILVVTFFIPDNQTNSKEPLFKNMFSLFRKKKMRYLSLSYLLGAIFSEFQGVFLMVFTFTITEDKFGVALLNIAYSLLIMGLIYLNKKLHKVNGVVWLFIGASIAFLGFGVMMFFDGWWLILSNFLIVAGNFYYSTTYYSQQFEAMNEESEINKERMLVWRENLLAFSRMILLGTIILIGNIDEKTMGFIFCMVMVITTLVPFVHKKMLEK